MMAVMKGLEWTFDTVASTYEKFRPGYVAELYQKMFQYRPIDESSRVLEVGIGGGQATQPILQTGCELTAVEYGENFSQLCREKFCDFPKFSVITDKFENRDYEATAYDLVYSASAFHWVPEEIGYTKVYQMLKTGGAFARFANHPHPDKSNPGMTEEIQTVYEKYYYPFHNKKPSTPKAYTEEDAAIRADIAAKYGFSDIEYAMYQRIRTFSAKEYITLLGTYSDHIAIEETTRRKFFNEIEQTIERHGGEMHIYDVIDLQLARKI